MEQDLRKQLSDSKRIVVKYGTRVLCNEEGRPNLSRFEAIASDVSLQVKNGREVVLFTSGAIGAGLQELNLQNRPKDLPGLQMAAAIGQVKLMDLYSRCFKKHGVSVAQILLTREDFKDKSRTNNFCNTINALLEKGVLPIINENDAIAVEEIKFGDNDLLSSLTAKEIKADALVLASTVNGFYRDLENDVRVSYLSSVTNKELEKAKGKGSELSSGGMFTKLESAQGFTQSGGVAVILDGRSDAVLQDAFSMKDVGTVVGAQV